jgi:hypothetical protein
VVKRPGGGMVAELVRITQRGQVIREEPVDRHQSVLEWR